MNTGAITGYFDVAQLVLYIFWIFFACLVFYLHREDKREGYPLEPDQPARGRVVVQGFPPIPAPKTFRLADGSTVQTPRVESDRRPILAERMSAMVGSPLQPTGNPMLDAVGPGSYALRADHPETMVDGQPVIAPMRASPGFVVSSNDPDPRGWEVHGADRERGGTVSELWVDRAEPQIRYLEVETANGRKVLLPAAFAKFNVGAERVEVRAILGAQFADVPGIAHPDRVTLLEEDRISAYYGGGKLYAIPARAEPLI